MLNIHKPRKNSKKIAKKMKKLPIRKYRPILSSAWRFLSNGLRTNSISLALNLLRNTNIIMVETRIEAVNK